MKLSYYLYNNNLIYKNTLDTSVLSRKWLPSTTLPYKFKGVTVTASDAKEKEWLDYEIHVH